MGLSPVVLSLVAAFIWMAISVWKRLADDGMMKQKIFIRDRRSSKRRRDDDTPSEDDDSVEKSLRESGLEGEEFRT